MSTAPGASARRSVVVNTAVSTATEMLAETPPAVAWTVVRPGAMPTTSPSPSTCATRGSSERQVMPGALPLVPSRRTALTASRTGSSGSSAAVAGSIEIETMPAAASAAGPDTVTDAVARRAPARASITALPGPMPVTLPVFETRATPVSDEAKANSVPGTRLPCRS